MFRTLIHDYRLRLAMFKGLGFEPIADNNGTVTKMLVRTCYKTTQLRRSADQRSQARNQATFIPYLSTTGNPTLNRLSIFGTLPRFLKLQVEIAIYLFPFFIYVMSSFHTVLPSLQFPSDYPYIPLGIHRQVLWACLHQLFSFFYVLW